jgi:Zn-dependent peptidase ImmA (M78 family)
MSGKELAQNIISQYQTTDVFELSKQAGVILIFEKWHPSTIGEFDKKTKEIRINLNATIAQERIIAHELGHFFLNETQGNYTRQEEETIVGDFVNTFFTEGGQSSEYCNRVH